MTTFLASSMAEVAMSKTLNIILNQLETQSIPPEYTPPVAYEQGRSRLELAREVAAQLEASGLNPDSECREYLVAGENKFVDAAAEARLFYLKAESYKYAALCARLSGRSPQVVRHYAKLALENFRKGRKEIPKLFKSTLPPLLDAGRVVLLWPVCYPIICATSILGRIPLAKATETIMFPSSGHNDALLTLWRQCETSDLEKTCQALLK